MLQVRLFEYDEHIQMICSQECTVADAYNLPVYTAIWGKFCEAQ